MILETLAKNSYIPTTMKIIFFTLILAIIPYTVDAVEPRLPEPLTIDLIVDLDREISGLLDSYLEAVPECPVYTDTPVRLWVLDLAWLRADAVINEIEILNTEAVFSGRTAEVWSVFLFSSKEYLRVFSEIQGIYHQTGVPENTVCIELENDLLNIDSLWRLSEIELFELLLEEEVQ